MLSNRILVLLLVIFTPGLLRAKVSAFAPTSLSNHEIVDRLEAYYCARTTFRAFEPQSHADLATALKMSEDQECQAPEWLRKERHLLTRPTLQNDFRSHLVAVNNDEISFKGTDARILPAFPLRQGRTVFNGWSALGEFNANAEGGQDWGAAVSATPGFVAGLDEGQYLKGRFYFHEGYLKGGYGRAELLYGRLSHRFGQTKHGSLIFSGAGKPLDLFQFTIRPHLLGGPFQVLGPFSFQTFLAQGGDSPFIKQSKIWGVELGMRPWTFFEIALLELFQFGGSGVPSLQISDLFSMLAYSEDAELAAKRRQNFGLHLNFWAPNRYAKIYTQFFFESFSRLSLSNDVSALFGLWFPKLGEWEARLEYVQTSPGAYGDSLYRQGWAVEGTPLGHPVGSDGRAIYLDVGFPAWGDLRPHLGLTHEVRNRNPAAGSGIETRNGIKTEWWRRWVMVELGFSAQYQQVKNHAYVPDEDVGVLSAQTSFRYSFY